MTGRGVAFVGIGTSCLLILAVLILPVVGAPWSLVALGGGVLGLSLGLVFLQLSFWREGEARRWSEVGNGEQPAPPAAPAGLRSPRLRRIWEGMESSRLLMESKEKDARAAERLREAERLGLLKEEEILFMEEPSWLSRWPIVVVSALLLLASAGLPDPAVSFLCLGLGLSCLLLLNRWRGRFRYYLTSFRVLVRVRPLMSSRGRIRWISLPYREIREVRLDRRLLSRTLRLEAREWNLDIRGLAPAHFSTAEAILRANLPALADKSDCMSRPWL